MSHDHRVFITILKTPWGYLTQDGFTKDINSKDIIVLRSNTFGKWSSMETRVKYFIKRATLSKEISEKLYEHASECETMAYLCKNGFFCDECIQRTDCQFWNGRRSRLKFTTLGSI